MGNAYYENLPERKFAIGNHTLMLPGIKLIEQVGEGGMATVWKAWDSGRQQVIAVKILNPDLSSDGASLRQFREEERMMEEIRHEGIVEAYDFANHEDLWYYTMEFVDGYTFAALLKRKQHVREEDCVLICESIAASLAAVWEQHGIVHCDIKPENIMINTSGVVKLTDLGISHRFQDQESPKEVPDHVLGTPAYISPEQVYGDVELDCRADIYCLAATLYHLSTGRLLFPGSDNDLMMRQHCDESIQAKDPRLYRPELSSGFCRLLETMLVKNRDYRLDSWQSVFKLCRAVEAGVPLPVRETMDKSASSIKLID